MKDIVETIQHEQDVVIRGMENDLLMVQGIREVEKPLFLSYRTPYFVYRYLQSQLFEFAL